MGSNISNPSGVHPAYASKREARTESSPKRFDYLAHFFLLLLSVAIWLIAANMVSVERPLQSAAQVQVKLDPSLTSEWRIVGESTFRISLKVSGPNHEINQFERSIEDNPSYFTYDYAIEPTDLSLLGSTDQDQINLKLDLRRILRTGSKSKPDQLQVQPLVSEGSYSVDLERFVTKPARINIMGGIAGDIGGFRFEAVLQSGFEVEVYGPASRVSAIKDGSGVPSLQVNAKIDQILQTQADLENTTVEKILKQGLILTSLPISPVEGVSVRLAGGTDEIGQVNVQLLFTERQNYVSATKDFPIGVILPNWLLQSKGYPVDLAQTQPLTLLVLSTQQANFNVDNVQLLIDLSRITKENLQIKGPEGGGPGKYSATISNIHIKLRVDEKKLTYKFENPDIDPDAFLPIDVNIEWIE